VKHPEQETAPEPEKPVNLLSLLKHAKVVIGPGAYNPRALKKLQVPK
jgi:hypothetical protein